jgi:hypothetical protein
LPQPNGRVRAEEGSLVFKDSKCALPYIKTFKDKPGVYLWTNKVSGKQYVGSSKNLFGRLEDYFQKSQLVSQAKNSNSSVCKALLKYSYSSFSLAIYLAESSADILALEQYYLDTCDLVYNSNRYASGSSYTPSTLRRSGVFVYDESKKTLLSTFDSVSAFMSFSGLNGSQIKNLMESETKLWRNTYFLSPVIIDSADNSMSRVVPFTPVRSTPVGKTFPVYVYKEGELEPLIFESKAKCAKALALSPHGVGKAILSKKNYKGYRISRSPLNKPFE